MFRESSAPAAERKHKLQFTHFETSMLDNSDSCDTSLTCVLQVFKLWGKAPAVRQIVTSLEP